MASLRNFINAITNDNRVYTAEGIGSMSGDEFMSNEKAIDYQMANLGIPRERIIVPSPMGLVVIIMKWMVRQLEEHQMLTISI